MELHSRAVTKGMGKFELQVLYARAMTRVWEKIGRLKQLPGLNIADFGTRRRHGFLWQDWCVQAMIEGLGTAFLGTSNCLIAMRREVEAIGTNAHELPMVYCALAANDRAAGRGTLQGAGRLAGGLRRQPARHAARHLRQRAAFSSGRRTGSRTGPACASIPATPSTAARSPSTGGGGAARTRAKNLPSSPTGSTWNSIEQIHRHFHGRMRLGYGWGTLLTNDFRGLGPDERLDPFSIVCKVISANGRPAVKLSDNPLKAIGPTPGGRALPACVPARPCRRACPSPSSRRRGRCRRAGKVASKGAIRRRARRCGAGAAVAGITAAGTNDAVAMPCR